MISDKLLTLFNESVEFRTLTEKFGSGWTSAWVEGLAGSAKAYFTAALREALSRNSRQPAVFLVVTPNLERAERLWEDLEAFTSRETPVIVYPSSLSLAGETTDADAASTRRRLEVVQRLADGERLILIAPVEALLQTTLSAESARPLILSVGTVIDPQGTAERLVSMGYERVSVAENPGEFALRGGILDVYPSTRSRPARIEFFGDEIESIRAYDPQTQRSIEKLTEIRLMPALEFVGDMEKPVVSGLKTTLFDHLPDDSIIIIDEPNQIKTHWAELQREAVDLIARRVGDETSIRKLKSRSSSDQFLELEEAVRRFSRFRRIILTLLARALPWETPAQRIAFACAPPDLFGGQIPFLASEMRRWMASGMRPVVISEQAERVTELLLEQGLPVGGLTSGAVAVFSGNLDSGFTLPGIKLVLLTDTETFGEHRTRAPRRLFKEGVPITSLLDLKEGDLVVHINHGIGKFRGLMKLVVSGVEREYLQIDYAEPDKVYVPSDELDRVQRYIGSGEHNPTINRLGGTEWIRTRMRVKAKVREMAKELIELYAAREAAEGFSFSPDTPWQREMEDGFPYEETPDQLDAIVAVKTDMEQSKPADRLICGDVGYGKTEVAIRAAFKAVNDGKQVAVLVPTTVLAQQHLNTFSERLAAFPVTVELLSRFRSRSEQKQVLEGLKKGTVDILIGTHRLLSKDIEFHDLGLLIVDEEQRFGVSHKERLKQLRKSVDVITLTATPIPRTLQMSLSGIRDMSVINDPPEGRIPVKTYFLEYDDEIVRAAVQRELDRGGQVYFVHNRVDNIEHIASGLQKLLPGARIGIGHGQMPEGQLERVMMDFYDKAFDVLVCTTIIESGLDIPNVNTIIINNADHFGLAQLYQLRGRVGRSSRQAYCFLLCKADKVLTEQAEKRLQAIREFTDLGSGYKIALRDLEIRGAGNLLGGEQSGFMTSVGFDLYCQMISEAVKELRGEEIEEFKLPPVDLPLSAYIPEDYIPSDAIRISFYKKLTSARSLDDVRKVQDELEDRFGDPPKEVWALLETLRLRIRAKEAGISEIGIDTGRAVVKIVRKLNDDDLRRIIRTFPQRLKFLPDRMLVNLDPKNILGTIDEIIAAVAPGDAVNHGKQEGGNKNQDTGSGCFGKPGITAGF